MARATSVLPASSERRARRPRKPRAPRNPDTRQTVLQPGQRWTVELGTLNGRVRRADYRRYMKSAEWRAKRQWWWEEAGRPGTCAACSAPWGLSCGDLHHRTYERLGYELAGDLVNLCADCHERVHAEVTRWSHLSEATDRTIAAIRHEHGLS